MMDDRQLLDLYATEGSEEAFAELTRRHAGLVYSAAFRQVRNVQLAQDVTQVVFANLSRKARSIPNGIVLTGWLHRDTRYTALDFIRAEARRAQREQKSVEMYAPTPHPQSGWEEISAELDEALTRLRPAERDALLLRYFEQRDFAAIETALGSSAEAARKRVDRALERLREYLVKRSITTTAAALSAALVAHAVEPAPVALVASLATGPKAIVSGGGWNSGLMSMTGTKIAIGMALAAGILIALLLMQQRAMAVARAEQSQLQARLREMRIQTFHPPRPPSYERAARDRADLERLRREAALVQDKIADFNAQAQRLDAAKPWHKPGGIALGEVLTPKEARDVGQATPSAAMQTFMWACWQRDTNRFLRLIVLEPAADAQRVRQKMLEVWMGNGGIWDDDFEMLLEDQPGENGARWIVAEVPGLFGLNPVVRFLLRPTAAGWGCVFGAEGNRVFEQIPDQP
jgi:RNA polymerase sigma factor (sigma-70 family)